MQRQHELWPDMNPMLCSKKADEPTLSCIPSPFWEDRFCEKPRSMLYTIYFSQNSTNIFNLLSSLSRLKRRSHTNKSEPDFQA